MAQTVWGQKYSDYLTDKEVEDFLKWEMKDLSNNRSEFFGIENKKFKILKKSNDWKVKYIIFHEDSLEYIDFFKEAFRGVDLKQFLNETEIAFLKEQFQKNRANIEFNKRINSNSFVSHLNSNELTIIYSVPLTTSDKDTYFILKDYTWDNRGEFVMNIYKRLENGQWILRKAQSVSEY